MLVGVGRYINFFYGIKIKNNIYKVIETTCLDQHQRRVEKMREKEIEQKLVTAVKQKGGLALKLVSPSLSGIPDRLILLNCARLAFVELKAPNKKPRPLQLKRIEQLKKLGFRVFIIDDPQQIGVILDEIQRT